MENLLNHHKSIQSTDQSKHIYRLTYTVSIAEALSGPVLVFHTSSVGHMQVSVNQKN